jgi:hypothetical protein
MCQSRVVTMRAPFALISGTWSLSSPTVLAVCDHTPSQQDASVLAGNDAKYNALLIVSAALLF